MLCPIAALAEVDAVITATLQRICMPIPDWKKFISDPVGAWKLEHAATICLLIDTRPCTQEFEQLPGKSDIVHPAIWSMYTLLHGSGTSCNAGVKSERATAFEKVA